MDLRPNDIIVGPDSSELKIVRPIGNGNFGMVYEVMSPNGERFALKSIITAWLNETSLRALINEGRIATSLKHKNIVEVLYFHDGSEHPNLPPYMIMELVSGGTLQNLIVDHRSKDILFTNEELRDMMLQLANGMKFLNDKLIHRDIKPDNVLIEDSTLKISDFGLSKIAGEATRSQTFKGIQHIMYCAPESWKQEKSTFYMDMYSMGIVFYELATLHHPYDVDNTGDIIDAWRNAHLIKMPRDPVDYNPKLKLGMKQMIMKMISKRPNDRYSSWDEIIMRLNSDIPSRKAEVDISALLERDLATNRKKEEARLQAEAESFAKKENKRMIEYSFNEIIQSAENIVNAFNDASDNTKLFIQKHDPLEFSLGIKGRAGSAKVVVNVFTVGSSEILDSNTIKAWGSAKAPSGIGFNIVLVSTSNDDLYGSWKTLHVRHGALARHRDNRPEPFPFELDELPREIKLLKALHIFHTKIGDFETSNFNLLIDDLLSK